MLKRELSKEEAYYQSNPRGMAMYHWSENGEDSNPYKLGSVECGEYIDEFHKLKFRYEVSA